MTDKIRNIDIGRTKVINNSDNPIVFLASRTLNMMGDKPTWKPNDNWLVVDSKAQAKHLVNILKENFQL